MPVVELQQYAHIANISGEYLGFCSAYNDERSVVVPSAPPDGFVRPRWVNNEWTDLGADVAALRESTKNKIDQDSEVRFLQLVGVNFYVALARMQKGMEAIDYWNDNLKPQGSVSKSPVSSRPSQGNPAAKERPIIEAEAVARGQSVQSLVESILSNFEGQWDLFSAIEAVRGPAKSAVDSAQTAEAINGVYAQWQTDIAAVTL